MRDELILSVHNTRLPAPCKVLFLSSNRGSRFQRAILKLRSDLDKKQSAGSSVTAVNGARQFQEGRIYSNLRSRASIEGWAIRHLRELMVEAASRQYP
jgi:hypothetical protein